MKVTPAALSAMRSRTRLVHAGRYPAEQFGFVNTPIYRGSTVLSEDTESFRRGDQRYTYGTHGTPTTSALEEAWNDLSGSAGTVLTPSGLAAVTIALSSVVEAGDHLLVTDSAYRPTRRFCDNVLKRLGVATTYYDPAVGSEIAGLITDRTRAVVVEAPGSQTFEVQDVPGIAEAAHARGVCVIMDNTWATPLFFPAHARGVDIVIEAGTKYLSGHSDLLLGLTSATAEYWPKLRRTFTDFGMCAGPEDVFLGLRGLRTMELRLREAERQALDVAAFLAARPEILRVLHPALPECPGHAYWKRDFLGSSGLFSVVLKPVSDTAVAAMLDGLELFGIGASWGGYESLVIPFDPTPYRTVAPWNPGGPGLRFSIGLEDVEDLKADLDRGFARLRAVA